MYYVGEVKQMHYTELRKIKPDLTDEEINQIKQAGSAWYSYFPIINNFQQDTFNSELVCVLFFNYLTEKKFVWKKKYLDNGGERVIQRDDTFNPPVDTEERFERVESTKQVWYDGCIVLGTNIMLKWEMMKNMIRNKSLKKAKSRDMKQVI